MGVYLPNIRLPSTYQEVEYIQSSGTQYIDTGYIPSNNTKIECNIGGWNTGVGEYQTMFGARLAYSASGRGFTLDYHSTASNYIYQFGGGRGSFSTASFADGSYHKIEFSQAGIYQNGNLIYTISSSTFTSPVNLTLFALNDNGTLTEWGAFKLYGCKIWDNGTLVRDFVPCYRKSDTVIGLYDLVNDVFYTNAGSGTFTKGSDVNLEHELKNAYIGELYPESIELDKSSISLTTIGQTVQLTATVGPEDAHNKSVTWSSDDTSIATVSTTGLVTCVTPGECTITATTVNGLTASCSVGQGWQPGANTVVYYPLNGDLSDYSGNNRNLTGNSVTFESGGPGQVAVFGSSSTAYYSNQSLFNISYPFTYSLYTQSTTIPTGSSGGNSKRTFASLIQDGTSAGSGTYDKGVGFANGGAIGYNYYNGYKDAIGGTANSNTWYYLVYTFDGATQKVYLNGALVSSNSCGGSYNGFSQATLVLAGKQSGGEKISFQGKISNFIFENKVWTSDEVVDYYNQTKSLYGIS